MPKAQTDGEFLEVWKEVSAKRARSIFASLWIEGPAVSGALKQEAVEEVWRLTWPYVGDDMTAKEKAAAFRANLDAIKQHTSELVDKTVAERWRRVTGADKSA